MVKHNRKLRRSSLNKLKRDFKIFDHLETHHIIKDNGFENLIDESYENLLSLEEVNEPLETKENPPSLENNDDFIAFDDDSSDDDNDDKENVNQIQSETDSDSDDQSDNRALNPDFPWLLSHNHTKELNISDWLTTEIKDFICYISPSKQEIKQRNDIIKLLRYLVKQLWSDASLHVFGSYATDLYLPGSDIDIVINSKSGNKEHRQYLYDLARHLKNADVATHIEVISRTRVPIIKFVEPDSGLHIDISFERTNGLDTAKLIRNWLSFTPGLRELTLIIKQFLASRRLNDVHTGGLGGFSIICMVYSFLSLHPKIKMNEIVAQDNLGVLLIEFFELYGKNFAYDEVALSFNEDEYPIYIPKSHWKALLPVRKQFSIAIQDPKDASNNLSRGSFNLGVIKKSFAGAFDLLTNKCFELNQCTFKDRIGKSILGNVIKYKGATRDFKDERNLIANRAIIENEKFHSEKRSYTIMQGEEDSDDMDSESDSGEEDIFLNPSDDDVLTGGYNDTEMYKLDTKTVKSLLTDEKKKKEKKKKQKHQSKEVVKEAKQDNHKKKKRKVNPVTLIKKHAPTKRVESVDSLMGLSDHNEDGNDDDDDGYNDSNVTSMEPSPVAIIEPSSKLKKSTVDAQTRRDYWLSKGNTLGSAQLDSLH